MEGHKWYMVVAVSLLTIMLVNTFGYGQYVMPNS